MNKLLAFGIFMLINLSILRSVSGHNKSEILLGDHFGPIIYNRTVDFPPATRSWYQSIFGLFSRQQLPVQNLTYTFPPNNTVSVRKS